MSGHNRVVVEAGTKKVFASAIDWPGWSRSAKSKDEALAALRDYAERYRCVADLAAAPGVVATSENLDVIEQVRGNSTTDFGAPGVAASAESEQMTGAECERQMRLLGACWRYFDETAGRVSEELQKGPRGGGRNRTAVVEHTFEAERSYARQIGVRTAPGAMATDDGLREHRDAVSEAIRDLNARGVVPRSWPLRYFIRRAAWHVLDHAWEMEDKDLTGSDRTR